ncbi:MAG: hypothetical protein EA366_11280 [Spirulina sp. DLM2.Bin59]|nr:MAG: hypothetical protein EA366_11280 [Spirulina sp. DLM2.Bin59]
MIDIKNYPTCTNASGVIILVKWINFGHQLIEILLKKYSKTLALIDIKNLDIRNQGEVYSLNLLAIFLATLIQILGSKFADQFITKSIKS